MKAEGHRQQDSAPPSWLDRETRLLVNEMIDLLAKRHPDVLAIILYGSIARHEERGLHDAYPSDLDLLVVVDADGRREVRVKEAYLFETIGLAKTHHLQARREINVLFSSRTSQEWDPTFIENVKHDGIILYQHVPLPAAFAT